MARTRKEISHDCYVRRKENGLCPRCGKEMDREGHYCSSCAEKVRKYTYDTRKWCREHHICTECRTSRVPKGESICEVCKAKKAWYRTTHPPTESEYAEILAANRYRSKIRYGDRKAKGICVACGKRPAAEGRVRCRACLEKNARVRRNYKETQKEWRDKGLCYKCGKPAYKTFKLCKSCYDKSLKALEKARAVSHGNPYWEQQNRLIFMKRKKEE